MSSIKMVALRKHPFGTGERDEGEEYEATADESTILIALGWAKEATAKEASTKKTEKAEKTVAADPTPPSPAEAAASKPADAAVDSKALDADSSDKKRAYQRRDLKAKD